jgi:hypothetical protein
MKRFTVIDKLKRLHTAAMAMLMAATVAVTPGCFKSNDNNSRSEDEDSAELLIGLTDAQGDFISYTVDVKSLTLTKANGAEVHTLPLATTVDFAQYTDMTEFLTAASVPVGVYVSAKMTLDYGNANIQVEDANGDAVKVSSIVDADGNPVSTLEVSVKLEGRNRLAIVAGVPASLTLDFDLAASNTVTFDGSGAATVTVEPILLADLQPDVPKVHRVRGALNGVNTAGDSFNVIIRPFVHAVSGGDERFGALTVSVDDGTAYEINGESYQGAAGLAQLAALTQFTAVVARGELKFNPRRFVATEVYAGSSVAGGTLDVVTGNVIARSGNTLTVRGATLIRADGSVVFHDNVTVTLADTTKVHRQWVRNGVTIADISVGQRVAVHGTLTSETAGSLSLDASDGLVRMLLTTLRGTVNSTATGSMAITLESIDGRRVDLFDFSGTGGDATSDADPTDYTIVTGALNLSGLGNGTPVKVIGFVTPFGSAAPDFTARTVIDVTDVRASLAVVWEPATAAPASSLSSASIVLDLTGSVLHKVLRAGVATDLGGTSPVVIASGARDAFAIKYQGVTQVYTDFATFVEGLQQRLGAGAKVQSLFARGAYDDATTTLSARLVGVAMS